MPAVISSQIQQLPQAVVAWRRPWQSHGGHAKTLRFQSSRPNKQNPKITKEQLMEMTIYALLEALWKLASNHNETFVTDADAELNVEETQEV
jgi:hypothetical protein